MSGTFFQPITSKHKLKQSLLNILITVSATETTLAQITTNNGYLYFQNSNQFLHGNNDAVLRHRSGHNRTTSFHLYNNSNTRLGAVYGHEHSNGTNYFGLLDSDGNWSIVAATDSYTSFKINNETKMTLRDNGQLDLIGTRDASGTSGSGVLEIGNALRLDNNEIITNTNAILYINHDNNGDVVFDANTLRIDASANRVGIGTSTPDNKLDVNGTIRAKEIKVESGWSDYVFYNDYQLPTLEEEEKHIKESGHLLGFESEKAMEGMIHLGDVSRRQQAKIEEMMLHLIELKKEVDRLKEENKSLSEKR